MHAQCTSVMNEAACDNEAIYLQIKPKPAGGLEPPTPSLQVKRGVHGRLRLFSNHQRFRRFGR